LNDGDYTDYYCTAVNILGKATSKIELIELRSATTHIEPVRMKSTVGHDQHDSSASVSSASTPTTAISKSATRALFDANKSLNNNNLVQKSNESVVRVSVKDENGNMMPSSPALSSSEEYGNAGRTTHKNRIHKLPNYRSNKANHTKHTKSKISKTLNAFCLKILLTFNFFFS
jgi:hypothetical protein